MQIYTTTVDSKITIASNNLDIRAPIKSSRGHALEINSILGLPIYEATNSIAAIQTGSLRAGEMVVIKPITDIVGETGVQNISQNYGFIPCKYDSSETTTVCQAQRSAGQNFYIAGSEGMYIDFIVGGNPNATISQIGASANAGPGIVGEDALETIPAVYRPALNKILTINTSQGVEQMRIMSVEHKPPRGWRLRVERGWNNTPTPNMNVNAGSEVSIGYQFPTIPAGIATLYMYEPFSERWTNVPLGGSTFKGS